MAFENLLRPGKINGMGMRNRFMPGPSRRVLHAMSDRAAAFTHTTMVEYDDPHRAPYR
jgi:hypothetical protein